MIRTSLLFASLLFLGGCASSWPTGVAENGYPILPRDRVILYESPADVPGAFEVLGPIRQYKERWSVTRVVSGDELQRILDRGDVRTPGERPRAPERSIAELRREAAQLGANGLLIVTRNDLLADARIQQVVQTPLDVEDRAFVAIYVGTPPEASGGSRNP